jgi:hemerythrin-like domain-containing protein
MNLKPSDILSNEHRVIEQVLNCLAKMADQTQQSAQIEARSAEQAIEFFRNFADRCHHGKEESHFFPAVEAKGLPRDGGPTGVMLHEHELGRLHVTGMSESVAASEAGDPAAAQRFVEHARAFITLLREHIHKEDHCLFQMADQVFTAADQERLLEAFARVESEDIGTGVHERYLQMAHELAARFGVKPVDLPAATGHGCCGH